MADQTVDTFKNYPSWASVTVEKEYLGGGRYKYTCITYKYNFDKLIDTIVEDNYMEGHTEHVGPDEETTIAGVIQKEYPSVYNTVTQLSQIEVEENKPFVYTMVNSPVGAMGLYASCANCLSLTSVDVKSELLLPFDSEVGSASYAFYNCTSLETVDISDLFESITTDCTYMFANCSELTTVVGKILITRDTIRYGYYNMFKGCNKLSGLQLIDRDGILLTDPQIAGFNGLYYNLLGLTSTDQFEIVTGV